MRYDPIVGEWVRITTVREGAVTRKWPCSNPARGIVVEIRAKNGLTQWVVLDEGAEVEQIPTPAISQQEGSGPGRPPRPGEPGPAARTPAS